MRRWSEIAEQAIPLVQTSGKTPAAIARRPAHHRRQQGGIFVKTAPGTFDVRELNPRGASKRPKAK